MHRHSQVIETKKGSGVVRKVFDLNALIDGVTLLMLLLRQPVGGFVMVVAVDVGVDVVQSVIVIVVVVAVVSLAVYIMNTSLSEPCG
jgi:hypothetical protein